MAGRKGGSSNGKKGKSGGDGFSPVAHEVIEFTPNGAFDIRRAAQKFSTIMRDSCQDLIIHLPHVSVEFEAGCTPEEIIEGYHRAMRHKSSSRISNSNLELV
jgi:hypothetical protein